MGHLRILAACLVAGACAAGLGCGGASPGAATPGDGGSAADEAIAVRIEPVRQQSISALYSTSATLRADRRATVIARTRGVIRRLLVEEGDSVRTGEALAELESDEQRIAAARARTSAETSRREVERIEGLLEQGLKSEQEFETLRRDAEDADHALALAELELSRTTVRAPFSGVVLRRHLDVGATVADGTPVYELADLSPLFADISVPERHVTRLQARQRVTLTADTTGATTAARIERIAPSVDPTTGTVKVTVAVDPSASLRPGAFVRVDITTDTRTDAVVVDRPALVAEGRHWYLFRLAEDGTTVEQVEVLIGYENGQAVEVAGVLGPADQLSPGDQVVVAGAPALSEGSRVKVVTPDQG